VNHRRKSKSSFFELSFTKIIYRYLVKKFISPFFLTFFLALLIILMQFVWKYVDDMVGKGLEWYIILKLLFYVSATFVSMALSLAVLLSSLMTFGTLGERYEVVAMKSSGIPITSLMKPLALISLLLSIFSFWFTDNVVPAAYVKWRSMMFEIAEQKPTLSIDEGVFYSGIDGYTILVGKKHRDNENIEDILIYKNSYGLGNKAGTYAQRGKMTITPDKKFFLFTLYNGYMWDETKSQGSKTSSNPYLFVPFEQQYVKMDISSFQMRDVDEEFFRESTKAIKINKIDSSLQKMNQELESVFDGIYKKYEVPSFQHFVSTNPQGIYSEKAGNLFDFQQIPLEQKGQIISRAVMKTNNFLGNVMQAKNVSELKQKEIRDAKIEWHQRLVLPLACFLFFFIGAPLGTIIRKGGIGIPLVITVVFFAFYFVISIFGEKLAKSATVEPWLGIWLSTLITIPIGALLTYKATMDSALLSADAYSNLIRKITSFFKKK